MGIRRREQVAADVLTKVKRYPQRASYDKELLLDILKNGFACHVAFQVDGQPFIIPMMYYNDSNYIYLHGSPVARIIGTFQAGNPIAISILELKGLVLAKGIASNSMNYRSVVIFGRPEELVTEEEKLSFVSEWIDRLVPGRKENAELPNHDELGGVSVFRVKLDKFSVKERKGGTSEVRKNPEVWSGVIPLVTRFLHPEFASNPKTPEHVKKFIDARNSLK